MTNMKNNNIFLIGPMGVGKTTIGRQLSVHLQQEFIDSDKEIEELTGASIPLIFELEGEAGFRQREQEMIDMLTQMRNIILATGGGVVLNPDNRRYLMERGTVIYLYADAEHLFKRTSRAKNRPLLMTENPKDRIAKILCERMPLYESVADLKIETGRRTVRGVVKEILRYVQRQETKPL